jgi:hypothetical protein
LTAFIGPAIYDTLGDIARERIRQEERCAAKRSEGENWRSCADPENSDDARFPVLAEEFGEVARELNDARAEKRPPGPNLRVELIQLAAVAAGWAEALARPKEESLDGPV